MAFTNARRVAEYILALSNPEIGDIISHLKLQKLLYYSQGIHLALFDVPLFEEEILAWRYGPVVKEIYHDYKIFGSNAILQPTQIDHQTLPKAQREFLNQIYIYFGQFSAGKLMEMTHEEMPWSLYKDNTIPKSIMKEFFKSQDYVKKITSLSKEDKLKKAANLLLGDYESNRDLTIFTSLDFDDFYETESNLVNKFRPNNWSRDEKKPTMHYC